MDQFLLGFAHSVYTVKGKRFTWECWIVSRFSLGGLQLRELTLMAWHFNILQKSFERD
jgi:hypothetical protein